MSPEKVGLKCRSRIDLDATCALFFFKGTFPSRRFQELIGYHHTNCDKIKQRYDYSRAMANFVAGMAPLIRQALAVARKDFRSELRTRYALNSLGMFIVVTVAVIAFSVGTERIGSGIAAAMIWVSMFFTAVTGLGRTFISEEERGTSLLLRLVVPSTPVYFGKLLVNIVLALVSNLLLSVLFLIMMEGAGGEVKSPGTFMFVVALSSLGFAGALTIIAALIARSGSKGALYPVISFPVILPLVVLGVDLLRRSMSGVRLATMTDDLLLLGLYTAALMLVSFFLFDLIWKE